MPEERSATPRSRRRRGLTREQILERALEIGDREGLEAVSLRRIASELGVTSMALYRHVNDKSDLYSGMLDTVMADFQPAAGIDRAMSWQDRVRLLLRNGIEFLLARPVTLSLQIAYSGPLTPALIRPIEDSLGILLDAGFAPRDAVSLSRTVTILLAALILLAGQGPGEFPKDQLDLYRRRTELMLLELPEDRFPVTRRHAGLFAETFVSSADVWINQTIELVVAGLEARLGRGDGDQRP